MEHPPVASFHLIKAGLQKRVIKLHLALIVHCVIESHLVCSGFSLCPGPLLPQSKADGGQISHFHPWIFHTILFQTSHELCILELSPLFSALKTHCDPHCTLFSMDLSISILSHSIRFCAVLFYWFVCLPLEKEKGVNTRCQSAALGYFHLNHRTLSLRISLLISKTYTLCGGQIFLGEIITVRS